MTTAQTCILKLFGRVIYDGPVVPGTVTDPNWWTLPRRLWVRLTPSGRDYFLGQIANIETDQIRQRSQDGTLDYAHLTDQVWDYVRDSVWASLDAPRVAGDPDLGRS